QLEAEVVMQAARRVLLNHEAVAAALPARAARFARFREVALGLICLQTGHGSLRFACDHNMGPGRPHGAAALAAATGARHRPPAERAAALRPSPTGGTHRSPRRRRARSWRRRSRGARLA